MRFPKNLQYTREHEWALIEGSEATLGITDFAQHQLGEVVYVELPDVGSEIIKDEPFGVVESVKAASDVYAPLSGKVLEGNGELAERPEVVNDDPYGDGWMLRISLGDTSELDDLMSADEYREYLAEEGADDILEGDDED